MAMEELKYKCGLCGTFKTPNCDCKIVECCVCGDSNHRYNMCIPSEIGNPSWNKEDYDEYLHCQDCIYKEHCKESEEEYFSDTKSTASYED